MALFKISELIPLEEKPRESSLRFLTQVWRNFGGFYVLERDYPLAWNIDGTLYLEAGNQRAIWDSINGIDIIEGEVFLADGNNRARILRLAEYCEKAGVKSFDDLVSRVRNPHEFYALRSGVCDLDFSKIKDRKFYISSRSVSPNLLS